MIHRVCNFFSDRLEPTTDRNLFRKTGVWDGGFFGVSIELGPRSDARLREATAALWGHASLHGCYADRDREPEDQDVVSPNQPAGQIGSWLYGVATSPSGKKVPCGTLAVRYEEGNGEDPADWLEFLVPMAGLGIAYPVGGFPFGSSAPLDWLEEVSEWMGEIGVEVYRRVPFMFGIVGHEVPMHDESAAWIDRNGIPESRWDGYLIPGPSGVRWLPPNEFGP